MVPEASLHGRQRTRWGDLQREEGGEGSKGTEAGVKILQVQRLAAREHGTMWARRAL